MVLAALAVVGALVSLAGPCWAEPLPEARDDGSTLLADVESSFGALVAIVGKGPAQGSRAVAIARDELDAAQNRLVAAIVQTLVQGDDTLLQLFVDRITHGGEFPRAALAGSRRALIRALNDRASRPGGERWAVIAGEVAKSPGTAPSEPTASGARTDQGAGPAEASLDESGQTGRKPAAPAVQAAPAGPAGSTAPVGSAGPAAPIAVLMPARPVLYINASLAYFGGQAAQELAAALAATGRFQIRIGAGQPGEAAYEVRLGLDPIRISTWPRAMPQLYVLNRPGGRPHIFCNQYVGPYDYDQTLWIHGRVQVLDLGAGREIARSDVTGSAFGSPGYFPGHGIGGYGIFTGPFPGADPWALSRAMHAAIADDRTGAVRTVLDSLPIRTRILDVATGGPGMVTLGVGTDQGIRPNDRFVALDGDGRESAVLRAQDVGAQSTTARVFGLHGNEPPQVSPGQAVVSRGY